MRDRTRSAVRLHELELRVIDDGYMLADSLHYRCLRAVGHRRAHEIGMPPLEQCPSASALLSSRDLGSERSGIEPTCKSDVGRFFTTRD